MLPALPTDNMEKVSLYIPCYNAEKHIKECLDSVINQSYKIEEIIVIDDGSVDNSADIIKDYPVKIIRNLKNRGLAASRNIAFKEAKNEFVAALDADCVAGPEWLGSLMKCFVSDDIAGAGGSLVERNTLTLADKWRSVHMAQYWGVALLENPPFLYGDNTVLRKKSVEKAGFYNEGYNTNYEDVDLSMRLYKRGFRLVYAPEAKVVHLRQDTIKSAVTTYWHWKYYKHMPLDGVNKLSQRIIARVRSIAEYDGIFKDFILRDLSERNYRLLPLDFICVLYCLWLDLKDIGKGLF